MSFLIAWVFWLLAWLHTKHYAIPIPLITLVIIGSFGPFLGAGVSTFLEGGMRETLRFYARALNLRMGWAVYHKGRGNIMSNMLFHTASNLGYSIVVLAPSPQYPAHDKYWYFTFFCILIAVLLWTLSPIRPERVVPASAH